jgi:hypothetical protein
MELMEDLSKIEVIKVLRCRLSKFESAGSINLNLEDAITFLLFLHSWANSNSEGLENYFRRWSD